MTTKTTRTGTVVAAFATLCLAMPAQAADLPHPSYKAPAYKAPAYVAPVYASWSGLYAGINGGYAFGQSDWEIPAVSPEPKGAVAGGTLGYNLQTGIWVWGIEGDFDWAGIKGSEDCGGGSCETKLGWLGTARARLGYAGWNNWLPYITGGIGIGDVKADNSLAGEASDTRFGWTAGLGIEYALLSHWSVKAEYLYVDLGNLDCTACNAAGADDNVSFKSHLVRAGLNYRF
jgi:outer membrane immunogenic protein